MDADPERELLPQPHHVEGLSRTARASAVRTGAVRSPAADKAGQNVALATQRGGARRAYEVGVRLQIVNLVTYRGPLELTTVGCDRPHEGDRR